ncbi:MAG: TlpA family protein disulfide reductase [candidate division Zixibacteria bacterium]|nr:TlpA family protein disulfide reductase [candidate division Zixibacteria bacterium]
MRFATIALTLIALMLVVSCGKQRVYTAEAFDTELAALTDDAKIAELFGDFIENAPDIDLVRDVQSRWEARDADGVRTFCIALADKNAGSARFQYLAGRVAATAAEQINYGRKATELDPSWSYGYRLVAATYSSSLFSNPDGPDAAALGAMLPEDGVIFERLMELEPEEEYAASFLYEYQVFSGNFEAAHATLTAAAEKDYRFASPIAFAELEVRKGNLKDGRKIIEDAINERYASETADFRNEYIDHYYSGALRDARAYDELITFHKGKKGYKRDAGVLYDIACTYSLMNNTDEAFNYLNQALAQGWSRVMHTEDDSDLEPLHADARWNPVMTAVKKNWDDGADERKVEALATKVSEPAPDWSLVDVKGDTVALADLRGQIVVLDFWATWCGPCRMAMPLINEFVHETDGQDVKVFSINVWERGRGNPEQFMIDNDYSMILLYGTDEIAEAYGVKGIPFLCVIDQDGNIRYKENQGFHEGLKENLLWWTEDLSTQGS